MLVVILVILPAAKENAGPLQSERSKDGLAGFALFFFNLVIPRSLLRGRALYKQGGWKKGRTEAV